MKDEMIEVESGDFPWSPCNMMKARWKELKAAARCADTPEMVQLILEILKSTGCSAPRFASVLDLVGQYEASLIAAGEVADTVSISEMTGILFRAILAIQHEGQPMDEFDELIGTLKCEGNQADTVLMAETLERLFQHFLSIPDYSRNGFGDIHFAESSGLSKGMSALLWGLAEVRPDFEELPELIVGGQRLEQQINISPHNETDQISNFTGTHAIKYNAPFPKEKRAEFFDLADVLESEGITTPEKIAQYLEDIADDDIQIRKYSQSLWAIMAASGCVPYLTPDWAEIYESQDKAKKAVKPVSSHEHNKISEIKIQSVPEIEEFKKCHSILRNVCDRYGDSQDRVVLDSLENEDLKSRKDVSVNEYVNFLIRASNAAVNFRKGTKKLPLAIKDDEILIGRHTKISFNRTLRIPEDGHEYPLPAGFGRLPILRVEDYADKVPAKWLEEGGFIIPLYQSEALFLEFTGADWRPTISKVAVGKINAVSGKEYDLALKLHHQDYMVIPEQRWLDGINSDKGCVRQFVAMPLGQGYTIEAQLTDEEQHGGFQIAVFDPKAGRFPEKDPSVAEIEKENLKRRARIAAENIEGHRSLFATSPMQLNARRTPELSLFAAAPHLENIGTRRKGASLYSRPEPEDLKDIEMGIGAGGRIMQQIIEDSYGAESWDPLSYCEVNLHIVNSAIYKEITGVEAPSTPITPEQYQKSGLPWYSDYEEIAHTVSPAANFKRIISVGQIDRERGKEHLDKQHDFHKISALHIRTPKAYERAESLFVRAKQSLEARRYKIAAREATLAMEFGKITPLLLFIRAQANLCLKRYQDAEADASSCIKIAPNDMHALRVRAFACIRMGEVLLAKNDADQILNFEPENESALLIRAESNLKLSNYEDALSDAKRLLQKRPNDPEIIKIKTEAEGRLTSNPTPL